MTGSDRTRFADVFKRELDEIAKRRAAAGFVADPVEDSLGSESPRDDRDPERADESPADSRSCEERPEDSEEDNVPGFREQYFASDEHRNDSHSPVDRESAKANQSCRGPRHRVGLALSGGGIRSASFNLGVLQALYQKGILRHIDYLSTVSGGGYVGTFLSSLATHERSRLKWGIDQGETDDKRTAEGSPAEADELYDIAPSNTGEQPAAVRKLIHGGMNLRKPLPFLNRYLLGVVTLNFIIITGLMSLALTGAIVFRTLDDVEVLGVMDYAAALGFFGDVRRALSLSTVLLAIWVVCWLWRARRERNGKRTPWVTMASKILCFLMLAFLAMAFVALLVTGDIALGSTTEDNDTKHAVHSFANTLTVVLLLLQLAALLPFLRLNEFIRSGTQPRNVVESWFFSIVSTMVVVGVPLCLFGYFAREDLSGVVSNKHELRFPELVNHRTPHLLSFLHVKDWAPFWRTVEQQAARAAAYEYKAEPQNHVLADLTVLSAKIKLYKQEADGGRVPSGIYAPSWRVAEAVSDKDLGESIRAAKKYREFVQDTWLWEYWFGALWLPLERWAPLETNAYCTMLKHRRDRLKAHQQVIKQVNLLCLSDPKFFRAFAAYHADMKTAPPGADVERIVELRDRAAGLWHRLSEEQLLLRADDSKTGNGSLMPKLWDKLPVEERSLLEKFGAGHFGIENSKALPLNDESLRLVRQTQMLNRQLLQAYFGNTLHNENTVFAYNVQRADQQYRRKLLLLFGGLFLFFGFLHSLNSSTIHHFYRERLGEMWLADNPHQPKRLSDVDTAQRGAPYLLINATVHFFGGSRLLDLEQHKRRLIISLKRIIRRKPRTAEAKTVRAEQSAKHEDKSLEGPLGGFLLSPGNRLHRRRP